MVNGNVVPAGGIRELARRAAVGLLVLTGVTHMSQLLIYRWDDDVLAAAAFGAIYLSVGLALLFKPGRVTLWLAIALPIVGGALGIARSLNYPNAFSIPHVIIDLIVAPICIALLYTTPMRAAEES